MDFNETDLYLQFEVVVLTVQKGFSTGHVTMWDSFKLFSQSGF